LPEWSTKSLSPARWTWRIESSCVLFHGKALDVTGPRFEHAMRNAIEESLRATRGKLYGTDGAAARLGLKPGTLQSKIMVFPVESGPNRESFVEAQVAVLDRLPIDVQSADGFERDRSWRPLREHEQLPRGDTRRSGMEYFHAAAADSAGYYWKK
jgi:hypothetical protein